VVLAALSLERQVDRHAASDWQARKGETAVVRLRDATQSEN
jgi:hypothetical protein